MTIKMAVAVALMAAAPAAAQMVESKIVATNGVEVSRNADDFAGRFEYSAPTINFQTSAGRGSGIALVAKTKRNGAFNDLNVQGFIMYTGEWQYFASAVFKGGEEVNYKRLSGDVGSCRYGCTLTENYLLTVTPAQIKKYAEAGVIPIQIRATKSGNTALLNIPVSYIDAVNEVAK